MLQDAINIQKELREASSKNTENEKVNTQPLEEMADETEQEQEDESMQEEESD